VHSSPERPLHQAIVDYKEHPSGKVFMEVGQKITKDEPLMVTVNGKMVPFEEAMETREHR
jgi:hypothetical protein